MIDGKINRGWISVKAAENIHNKQQNSKLQHSPVKLVLQ